MASSFPADFLWGAATASYQIEGAACEDGRGESIWDRFSHTPGKVLNGDTGDVACDHYHRWADDIRLMQSLGLKAYRFSIAWPRILPEGTGAVNEAGLAYYERLVDALLAAGITPFVTLYHWDLPQALQERGGWPSRDSVGWFTDYADVVSRRLGDRVRHWITHNEPQVAAFLGHATGEHAPGLQDYFAGLRAAHHLLLSHGRAVPVLRANGGAGTQVGITLDMSWIDPASDSEADLETARLHDVFSNRLLVDPVLRGKYPEELTTLFGGEVPWVLVDDPAIIAAPLDFLGLNYYTRAVFAADAAGDELGGRQVLPEGAEYTEMGWEVYPEGLYRLLRRLHEEYAVPAIYVTESGAAFTDSVEGGCVHDARRVSYLREHFAQAHRAIAEGVPLRGYFVWSLMDNFEWAYGYSKRFGLVYVDYATQERTLKDSALWYRQVIAANAVV